MNARALKNFLEWFQGLFELYFKEMFIIVYIIISGVSIVFLAIDITFFTRFFCLIWFLASYTIYLKYVSGQPLIHFPYILCHRVDISAHDFLVCCLQSFVTKEKHLITSGGCGETLRRGWDSGQEVLILELDNFYHQNVYILFQNNRGRTQVPM